MARTEMDVLEMCVTTQAIHAHSCLLFESVSGKNNSSQTNIQILDLQKLPIFLRCRYMYI